MPQEAIIALVIYIITAAFLYFNGNFKNEGLFDCRGRLIRLAFLTRILALCFVAILLQLIASLLVYVSPLLALIIESTISALSLILYYVFMIKRLHDLNFSGKYVVCYFLFLVIFFTMISSYYPLIDYSILSPFLLLFFIINIVLFILLFFIRGTKGNNKYGSDPFDFTDVSSN